MQTINTKEDLESVLQRAQIDRSLSHPAMFLTASAAIWFIVSMLLGLLSTIKLHSPNFFTGWACLDFGRLYAAHQNGLIYGWGVPVGVAAMLWVTSRVTGKQAVMPIATLIAGMIWNVAVSLGTVAILMGYGSGISWFEYPSFAWPVMIMSYLVMVVGSIVQLRVRDNEKSIPTAQWYLIAGLFFLPWLMLVAYVMVYGLSVHPLMVTAIGSWYKSGILFLFMMPIALGVVSWVFPMVTGNGLLNQGLSKFGIGSLVVIAPWAGMQKLIGAPVPVLLPYLSGAAAALLFVPAVIGVYQVVRPNVGECKRVSASPALRFMMLGLVSLLLTTGLGCVFYLPESWMKGFQFSIANYSAEVLGLYGFFSCVMIGLVYYMVPRLTKREWLSSRMIRWHYLGSLYGVVTIVVVTIASAIFHGAELEDYKLPILQGALTASSYAYAISFAWVMILVGNGFFLIQLLCMAVRFGRRAPKPTLFCEVPVDCESVEAKKQS